MKKFWKVTLAALAVVIVLAIIVPKISVAEKERTDRIAITKAARSALVRNNSEVNDREVYLQSLGLIGPRVAYSQTESCYIDHDDAGWIARNYNQKCFVRSIIGYQSNGKPEQMSQHIKADTLEDPWSVGFGECNLLQERYGTVSTVILTGPGLVNPAGTSCDVAPNPTDVSGEVVAYAVDNTRTRVMQKSGEAWTDMQQTTIWFIHTTNYWNENLGCSGVVHLMCNSPRSTPIMAR